MNNKNKLFLSAVIAFALSVAAGSNASANTLILDYGTHHSGNGGEFNAFSATLNPVTMGYVSPAMANVGHGGGFETFCLEFNEEFIPGGTYNYSISDAAFHGGVPGGSDPLSIGTAWLYLNFAKHTLTGYDYTNADAGALQNTIWWLEGEAGDPGSGNEFRNLVLTQFGGGAAAMANNNGFYGVGVLNLTYLNGNLSQDQLTLVPDGGTTAMLLGLGLLALFLPSLKLFRRRRTFGA